jgi:NADH dehydrogenase
MKVFLTGGTGFVGRQIVRDLMKKDYSLRCLVREGSESKLPLKDPRLETVHGDIRNIEALKGNLEGFDAVIHIVGIIREFPRNDITFEKIHFKGAKNLIDVAAREGVKRFVLMSALGADLNAKTSYHITKAKAEEYLRSSGMTFTIIRPSIIFGKEDQFVNTFARMIRRAPFIPVIGDGQYQLQPISVKNVSEAFIKSVESPVAENQSFDAGGPDKLAFDTILDCIGKASGKKARKMHVPVFLFRAIVTLMQKIPSFPITRDQMEMLLSGNICDEKNFFEMFQIKPITFKAGIETYLSS